MNAHQRRIEHRKHLRSLKVTMTWAEQMAKASCLFAHQLELLRGTINATYGIPRGLMESMK